MRSPALRRSLALFYFALATLGVEATEVATPPQAAISSDASPGVEEILARNATARGGLDSWRSIKTFSEKGYVEHGQIKGPKKRHGTPPPGQAGQEQSLPFTLQIKRPHQMRVEMKLGDATALQLFDGNAGWVVQPSSKGPMLRQYSQSEATAASEQVDPEGPLLDAAAKGTSVSLEGEDVVEGHRAYKLALTLKNGAQRHVWVDAQSFLDLKIDGMRMIEGKPWTTETYFYDWKNTGAVKLPHRIETAINDVRTTSRIIVEHVLINTPLAETLFALPSPSLTGAAVPGPAAAQTTPAPSLLPDAARAPLADAAEKPL